MVGIALEHFPGNSGERGPPARPWLASRQAVWEAVSGGTPNTAGKMPALPIFNFITSSFFKFVIFHLCDSARASLHKGRIFHVSSWKVFFSAQTVANQGTDRRRKGTCQVCILDGAAKSRASIKLWVHRASGAKGDWFFWRISPKPLRRAL